MLTKIKGVFLLYILLLSFSVFAGSDTQTNFDGAKTDIVNIQNPDSGLPTGVSNQKGKVGNILSRLFGNDGKINNFFLRVLGNRSDGSVLRWSGGNGGKLVEGNIYDDGTRVGIGNTDSRALFNVAGNLRSSGNVMAGQFCDASGGNCFSSGDVALSGSTLTGGGTTNYLPKFTSANSIANSNISDNGTRVSIESGMTINSSAASDLGKVTISPNGSVGIGTINPQEKLHVAGQGQVDIMIQDTDSSGAEAVTAVEFHDSAGVRKGYVGDGAPTQEDIYLTSDSGSVRLRNGDEDNLIVTPGGNVGIGTTAPSAPLDIGGQMFLGKGRGSVALGPDISFDASGFFSSEASLYFMLDQDNNSTNQFFRVLANDDKIGGGAVELFQINESGNVGIGTISPRGRLHITGGNDVSHTSTNVPLLIGKESGENIAIDNNEIMARNNGNPRELGLNWEGGGVILNSNAGGKLQVGTQAISGNYGTVLASGAGKGGWDGYSIENGAVFMYNGTNMGLYNDVDNEWVYYGVRNGTSQMYYNGGWKIKTESNGARINGNVRASRYCDANGGNCTDAIDLRTRCTARNYARSGNGYMELPKSGSYRRMIMPESTTQRCRELGYDIGFPLKTFQPKNGSAGWCGFSNARTAYYSDNGGWRYTSPTCVNGAVHTALCCHIN